MRMRRGEHPDEHDPVELAALADGTLPDDRRAELEAHLLDSSELRALLAEQERAVALIRGAVADVEAPAGLRRRIEVARGRKRSLRPFGLVGIAATAAVAALILLLVLPGGVGGPTVAEAATLGALPPTAGAPPLQPGEPKLLAREVEGVPFPNWTEKFGWRAAGERTDTLDGRETTTVFYRKDGKEIAYTIVAGNALAEPEDAAVVRREGTDVRVFRHDGRLIATWLRGGKTCVLSGVDVGRDVLAKLAAWKGKGSVPF